MLDKVILDSETLFEKGIKEVEKKFYKQLVEKLQEFSNKGKLEFSIKQLAELKKSIDFAFSNTGYKKVVEAYLSTYNLINADNINFYNEYKLSVENLILKSDLLKEMRMQVTNNLLSQNNIDVTFLKPIENMLRIDIIRGLSYKDAEINLRQSLIDKKVPSNLMKYIKTISRDALRKYDGQANQNIKDKFGFTKFIYVASLIETSRPFCIHMKTKREWNLEQLKEVLDEYIPNGNPSKVETKILKYVKKDGTKVYATKGDGMEEGTNVDNFSSNVGGHGCRHSVRWVA